MDNPSAFSYTKESHPFAGVNKTPIFLSILSVFSVRDPPNNGSNEGHSRLVMLKFINE